MPSLLPANPRLPMWLKVAYTAFVAVLVPIYWKNYGPANFVYFCDIALLLTLPAIWLESPLLVSMPAVGILMPQMVWCLDFAANLVGLKFIGMTDYMFDTSLPRYLRALSLFHGWLPFLLVYLVWRLGYDRRALAGWTVIAVAAMLVAWFFLPGPRPDAGSAAVNVNYVYGIGNAAPQTWMPGWAWLACLVVGLPALMFLPTHLALRRWLGDAARRV